MPQFLRPLRLGLAVSTLLAALAIGRADDTAYRKVVAVRAEKIVAALALPDAARKARVTDIVAQHYLDLRAVQDARDTELAAAKSAADKNALQAVRDEAAGKLPAIHEAFLARLATELTPAQIDVVKDGITYGVLPLTYRVYLEMLPALTEAQKKQIHDWLVEAREHAVDGFTSDEKHAWFEKYKGRINNYLAKAGYDMKQAEKEMLAREKKASAEK